MKNKLLLALVISIGASLFFTLYTPTVAVEQNVTKLKPLIPAVACVGGFCRSRAPRSCASQSCNWHKFFLLMVVLS